MLAFLGASLSCVVLALSLFFSLSLSFQFFLPSCFFHIIPAFLFFCTSDNSRFLTVTCVPRYGARGESDAVGWNRSQNTLSLDELPGGKLMHAGLLPSLFSEMLSGIIDARRAVSPSQRWVYLKWKKNIPKIEIDIDWNIATIDLSPAVDLQRWLELCVWAKVIYVQCIGGGSAYRKSCFHSCRINLRLCCWRHAEWPEPGSSGACLSSRANTCSFRLVPLSLLLKDSHRTASRLLCVSLRAERWAALAEKVWCVDDINTTVKHHACLHMWLSL